MGKVAVITSGKGGAGKSTVTVGLGRELASRGRRVLLVDCDAGLRSLDRMTGAEQNLVFDISDVVFGRCAPIEAIYPCRDNENLFLLPAPSKAEDMIKPAVMKKLVNLLRRYFDYVLLDSPAGVGRGFRSASCAADRAIIICNPDPVSVRSASIVKNLLESMNIHEEELVINRLNGDFFAKTAAFDDLDSVIDETGIPLIGVVPEDFELASAFLKGNSADKNTKGAKAISRITARLEGEMIPISLD